MNNSKIKVIDGEKRLIEVIDTTKRHKVVDNFGVGEAPSIKKRKKNEAEIDEVQCLQEVIE